MKSFNLVVILATIISSSALADEMDPNDNTATTPTTAIAWTTSTSDPSIVWSDVLPGTFMNCDPTPANPVNHLIRCQIDPNTKKYLDTDLINNVVSNSPAIAACKAIDAAAVLPTKAQFEKVRNENIVGMNGHWFWSQSVDPANTNNAYGFNGTEAGIDGFGYRFNSISVRCVKPATAVTAPTP